MTQDKEGIVESRQSGLYNDENAKQRDRKEKNFQTKVVIRRLPPTMTQEQFLEQISPVPENDYFYFVRGDMSLGVFAFSRAYISFVHQEDIFIFKDKFDDYVFVDNKGNEYPAVVEFAPFQKIPKKRVKKKDMKCGTIEQDSEYLKFLESIDNPEVETPLPSAETYLEEIEAREKELKANSGVPKMTTPLIEFLKQRKLERQKMRDEKREERKRRDLERKRIREEERRRRKAERDSKERSKDTEVTTEEEQSAPSPNEALGGEETQQEAPVLKVLKNPEREKDKAVSSAASFKGAGPKSTRGGRRDWDRRDRERQRDRERAAAARERERNKRVKDDYNTGGGKEQTAERPSQPVKGFATKTKATQQQQKSTVEKSQHDDSKDPRLDRRIRNKDRPSLEIYRPGMRKMGSQRDSPQKETASNASSPSVSPTQLEN